MKPSFDFPAIALVTFAAYLLFVIVARVGRRPSPVRAFCRLHFYFTALYGALSAVYAHERLVSGAFSMADWAVGLACYFFLQYSWFFILFGQLARGFSLNICVLLHERGGGAALKELLKGSEFIQADRIKVMRESGVVVEHDGGLSLTRYGATVVAANRLIQRAWNLDYLGKS